jgi:hypothetical protein
MSSLTVHKDRPRSKNRARTPPPTLLFLSSLVKEQMPHTGDTKEPRISPPPKGRSFWRSGNSRQPNRAVDEAYLANPTPDVNSTRKIFDKLCEAESSLHKYRQSNPVHKNACTSVLIVAEGPNPAANASDETPEEQGKAPTTRVEPSHAHGRAGTQNRHKPNRTKPQPGIAAHAKKLQPIGKRSRTAPLGQTSRNQGALI